MQKGYYYLKFTDKEIEPERTGHIIVIGKVRFKLRSPTPDPMPTACLCLRRWVEDFCSYWLLMGLGFISWFRSVSGSIGACDL